MNDTRPVLVGIDGSAEGSAALHWAAAEAQARATELMVVHVADTRAYGLWMSTATIRSGLRELARPVVDHAVVAALRSQPRLPVRGRVVLGSPAASLVRLSHRAQLVVVGRQGRGAMSRLVLGSVAQRLVVHAGCPVITVPETADTEGPHTVARVVVGIGDRPTDGRSLEFAAAEAARRGVALTAVHTWHVGPLPPPGLTLEQAHPANLARLARDHLAAALLGVPDRWPALTLHEVVWEGYATELGTRFCGPTDLLVLGRHVDSGLTRNSLGSVVSAALHHAPCAVATVTEPATSRVWSTAPLASPSLA